MLQILTLFVSRAFFGIAKTAAGDDGCQENAYSPVREQLATEGRGANRLFFSSVIAHVMLQAKLNSRFRTRRAFRVPLRLFFYG